MPIDLILYAAVAAGLVFWLRSVLGTRHGEERDRPNPFASMPVPTSGNPETDLDDIDGVVVSEPKKAALPKNVVMASADVEAALAALPEKLSGFDLSYFATVVQDAFVMIVEAFAKGDKDTLNMLLEPQVFEAFARVIDARAQSGETVSTEIHAIRTLEFMDVKTDAQKAFMTLRFVADETCVVKSAGGAIVSGNPDRTTQMNDIWVFAKPLKSKDGMWFLSQTRDGDVAEDHKTPVPELHS